MPQRAVKHGLPYRPLLTFALFSSALLTVEVHTELSPLRPLCVRQCSQCHWILRILTVPQKLSQALCSWWHDFQSSVSVSNISGIPVLRRLPFWYTLKVVAVSMIHSTLCTPATGRQTSPTQLSPNGSWLETLRKLKSVKTALSSRRFV
jgi:hypothetical protein